MGTDIKKYLQKYNWRKFWQDIEQFGVKWWSEMNWTPDGKELWYYLIQNYEEIEILTGSPFGKVGQYAHQGKEKWVASELGDYKVNHYSSSNKWRLAQGPEDILIDDTPKVINLWEEKGGGTGILHTDVASTIEKLKAYESNL